jgi:thioredoxin:protein disulfide reductase
MHSNRLLILLLTLSLTPIAWGQLDPRTVPSFGDSAQSQRNMPLALERAFPYYVSEAGADRLQVSWTPAPGHYLYRHAFSFSLRQADGSESALNFDMPEGLKKTDPFFGDIEAYYGTVSVDLGLPSARSAGTELMIEFQGCADWGFCYPPQRVPFALVP